LLPPLAKLSVYNTKDTAYIAYKLRPILQFVM